MQILTKAPIAAGIICAGIDYAAKPGFSPHADFRTTQVLIGSIQPADVCGRLKLGGPDGKPLYIAGPEDDARAPHYEALSSRCRTTSAAV